MHIARVAFPPNASNAHMRRLRHRLCVWYACRVQHRLLSVVSELVLASTITSDVTSDLPWRQGTHDLGSDDENTDLVLVCRLYSLAHRIEGNLGISAPLVPPA